MFSRHHPRSIEWQVGAVVGFVLSTVLIREFGYVTSEAACVAMLMRGLFEIGHRCRMDSTFTKSPSRGE